jgi:hypothetical protein
MKAFRDCCGPQLTRVLDEIKRRWKEFGITSPARPDQYFTLIMNEGEFSDFKTEMRGDGYRPLPESREYLMSACRITGSTDVAVGCFKVEPPKSVMTPSNIKAFLDEIAGASYRHGIAIDGSNPGFPNLITMNDDFAGYIAGCDKNGWAFFPATDLTINAHGRLFGFDEGCHTTSIDITQLSAHERIQIHGTQSPDLAQMLRDAFMSGVEATRGAYVGPHEFDADDYAKKIMGGQG